VSTTIDALAIRKRLGREHWGVPRPFGEDGWSLDHTVLKGRIIVTASEFTSVGEPAGEVWVHASISWVDNMPSYGDLTMLHRAVWPAGFAYQVFAPPTSHVNIHSYALHLWGRDDGRIILPDFGKYGTI
jgi:hypothetical protein